MAGLRVAADRHGVPLHLQGLPSVFNTTFSAGGPIRSAAEYARSDTALQGRFLVALQERGVRPTARGTWFVSTTHDDAVIDETIEAAAAAAMAIRG